MNNFFSLKTLVAVMLIAVAGILESKGQNITASQLNIYFGHPKQVTVVNPQGTAVTEFDKEGRITSVTQGNMKMVYDWAPDGKTITLSMYIGVNIQEAGVIEVTEFTKEALRYKAGVNDMSVTFKENGAIDTCIMKTPQGEAVTKYLYRNTADAHPYACDMSMGDQGMKLAITINKTDDKGNSIEFTQELMGQKQVTTMQIEYY